MCTALNAHIGLDRCNILTEYARAAVYCLQMIINNNEYVYVHSKCQYHTEDERRACTVFDGRLLRPESDVHLRTDL